LTTSIRPDYSRYSALEEAAMLLDRVREEPFDASGGDPAGHPWLVRARRRCVVALVLSSTLAVIVPLALASPPDPVSIDGVYDAADYDDVVLLVTSQDALAEGCVPVISLVPIAGPILPETSEGSSTTEPRSVPSRAPPKF
jgi:hypothetical protein